jgi:hypothetical protein
MSGSAIPAAQIVSVVPSVLNAGGVGLDLNGLLLTQDQHIPLGEVYSFPDLTSVQSFFGPTGYISALAKTYFLADINATKRPGQLLIACVYYNQWVPAWLMSAQKPTLTLDQLQATTPNSTFTFSVNGVSRTTTPISLSTATSFSMAAQMIGAATKMDDGYVYNLLTASFAAGTMTVTANEPYPPFNATALYNVAVGDCLFGPGIPPGTYVTQFVSGVTPGASTWKVNNSFTHASQAGIQVARNPCSYDAQTYQFRIQSAQGWMRQAAGDPDGYLVTMSHLTGWAGNLAPALGLNQGSGARLNAVGTGYSPGGYSPSDGVAGQMASILKVTQNWATFMHTYEVDNATTVNTGRQQFAAWVNSTQNNYMYACWDTDVTPTLSNSEKDSLGQLLNTAISSGTAVIYSPNVTNGRNLAAFMMGTIASIDFERLNGRKTIAFRGQSGITPDIISGLVASNLEANHYNYYGIWTTANDQFRFMYPGIVSGLYKWIDSYINQIWMNNAFQLALMELLTQSGSIPYNQTGYTMIKAACQDVINSAVNFGAIRPGVTLSEAQKIEVNNMAGVRIDGVLNSIGYHLQVLDANPQVRAARGTPPCTFWYMDGGSIQRLTLASVMVQ